MYYYTYGFGIIQKTSQKYSWNTANLLQIYFPNKSNIFKKDFRIKPKWCLKLIYSE